MRLSTMLPLVLAALPFAAGFSCDIHIDDPDDDCPDLEELCPNLQCADGFAQNDDGCSICECADAPTDGGPAPDQDGGPAPHDTCMTDADCLSGQLCDTVNFCESDCGEARPGEPSDCLAVCLGRCVDAPPPPSQCASDADCPAGQHCDFSSSGAAPCAPDSDCGRPQPLGQCVDDEPSCGSDADCAAGERCEILEVCAMFCEEGDPTCCGTRGTCVPADDGCFGAWVDETNTCRSPSDGVYPAECCFPTCSSDADCPNGYCEQPATCAGLDCPPPPPAQCVFPSCDDDSQAICDMVPPTCPAGQTAAIRGGCYACVDARTCEPVQG